jgi:formate hydrogenlyase transcriptional activator
MPHANDPVRLTLEKRVEFEALIADLSAHFINLDPSAVDDAIDEALARLGLMLDVDRGAVTQLADEDGTLVYTHYWSRAGDPPPPHLRVDSGKLMPFVLSRLMNGDVHCFSSLDELPVDAPDRAFLAQRNVKSAVVVPLVVAGQVIGSLGFSATEAEHQWDDDLVRRLRLVADVFASTFARKRLDAHLRSTIDDRMRFETLIADLASTFVNLDSDLVDGAIEDAQGRLVDVLNLDRSSLFQLDPEGNFVLTHYRSRPEFPPSPIARGSTVHMFPWIGGRVLSGHTVCISSVNDIPADAPDREHLQHVGTRSNVTIPLVASGRVIGALAFGTMREERTWPAEIVNRLSLIGQVFATAQARKRTETELRKTLDENARLRDRLIEENVYLQNEVKAREGTSDLIGSSAAIRSVLGEVDQVARTGATVLLLGETGTGKELIATAIHERSQRSGRPMVRVNCAAIPMTLIESELFGREKGAYTGALARQTGRFELADGSTIFLDEVGELPTEVQVKLLRVLQERHIERLGSSRSVKIDVRVIAATNRDLEHMIAEGTFREDLYYRLNVFPIRVPPLRERPEDIPTLVWAFVEEFSRSLGKRIESISKEHMLGLQRYAWPGNVRELRNVVERAVIVSAGPRLAIEPPRPKTAGARRSLKLEDVEREHLRAVLERTGWRVRGHAGAAEILGLKPSTLEDRMSRFGLRRPRP